MEFVLVQGGCFNMGNNFSSDYFLHEIQDELPVHHVCIDSFYMGRYPVTQSEWEIITGENPAFFQECGSDCPVENVSWNDVQNYLRELNAIGEMNYRLPTEAEWEYAARNGGKVQKYAGIGQDVGEAALGEYAWYRENSGIVTHPVGLKLPSELGLYDLSGNVLEWVEDYYGPYPEAGGTSLNPSGPEAGEFKIFRGSSFSDTSRLLRASLRDFQGPDFKAEGNLGFRLVLPVVIEE